MDHCYGCARNVDNVAAVCQIECDSSICTECIEDSICEFCGRAACDACQTTDRDGHFACVQCVQLCDTCNESVTVSKLEACEGCTHIACPECTDDNGLCVICQNKDL